MSSPPRERILQATFDCVGRHGIAKTTVEDAARAAGVSRATVYRYFAGGKDELIRETIFWETGRFFDRMTAAVGATTEIEGLLEEMIVFARQAVLDHAVLQKVLETEPERLLPALTSHATVVLALLATFLHPSLRAAPLREGVTPERAADHLARMLSRWSSRPAAGFSRTAPKSATSCAPSCSGPSSGSERAPDPAPPGLQ